MWSSHSSVSNWYGKATWTRVSPSRVECTKAIQARDHGPPCRCKHITSLPCWAAESSRSSNNQQLVAYRLDSVGRIGQNQGGVRYPCSLMRSLTTQDMSWEGWSWRLILWPSWSSPSWSQPHQGSSGRNGHRRSICSRATSPGIWEPIRREDGSNLLVWTVQWCQVYRPTWFQSSRLGRLLLRIDLPRPVESTG